MRPFACLLATSPIRRRPVFLVAEVLGEKMGGGRSKRKPETVGRGKDGASSCDNLAESGCSRPACAGATFSVFCWLGSLPATALASIAGNVCGGSSVAALSARGMLILRTRIGRIRKPAAFIVVSASAFVLGWNAIRFLLGFLLCLRVSRLLRFLLPSLWFCLSPIAADD